MSEQPKEPSQWAKDVALKIAALLADGDDSLAGLASVLEVELDAATASKDAEIKRLKIAGMEASCARDFADLASERKDQRIAALEALLERRYEALKKAPPVG